MDTATKEMVTVSPFAIEIDEKRNRDVLLRSIPNCRLRSALSADKSAIDKKGDESIPDHQMISFGRLPRTPGMQVHVNPEKLECRIIDPLHGDEELCEKLRNRLNSLRSYKVKGKLDGVPPRKEKMDKHRMKNLCREMLVLVDAGNAKIVKGVKPDIDDIDGSSGRYLLNPTGEFSSLQPRYQDEYEEWVGKLSRLG